MEKTKFKRLGKFAIKLIVAAVILYFVYRKIDSAAILEQLKRINLFYLLPAVALFVLSKVIASIRLNRYLKTAGINVSDKYNMKLYWLGMFYNLFLPGGVGGDGYKVFVFKKTHSHSVKELVSVMLLDRISGVFSLGLLMLAFSFFLNFGIDFDHRYAVIPLLIAMFVVAWIGLKKLFKKYTGMFFKTMPLSILVQTTQVLAILCLLSSLNSSGHEVALIFTFLVSSIAAIAPITPGGIGLREWTFQIGSDIFGFDPVVAPAIGTLFFLITLVVSFWGIIYHFKSDQFFGTSRDSQDPE